MKKTKKETYFWKQLVKLCAQRKIYPNNVTEALGLSKATATNWKDGSIPRDTTLLKVADYFGVSVDYFKEDGDKTDKAPPEETPATIIPFFSSEEIALIYAYRSQPKLQQDVKRLLGFPEEKDYLAAKTKQNHKHVKNKLDDPNAELSNKVHNARLDETDVK